MEQKHRDSRRWAEHAVLDIGGEIGALIVYTGAKHEDREVEVSPLDDDATRIHTVIHARRVQGEIVFAGIFPELRAGDYRIWTTDARLTNRVTVVGGALAEVDWRSPPESSVSGSEGTPHGSPRAAPRA
jgi:hypothetical protein